MKLLVIIKGEMCRDKGDVVKLRLFHQRTIIQENCNNQIL